MPNLNAFVLLLLVLAPAPLLSSNTRLRHDVEERALQDTPEICGYTTKWDWEGDGYKHPVVPCLGHDDCVRLWRPLFRHFHCKRVLALTLSVVVTVSIPSGRLHRHGRLGAMLHV